MPLLLSAELFLVAGSCVSHENISVLGSRVQRATHRVCLPTPTEVYWHLSAMVVQQRTLFSSLNCSVSSFSSASSNSLMRSFNDSTAL